MENSFLIKASVLNHVLKIDCIPHSDFLSLLDNYLLEYKNLLQTEEANQYVSASNKIVFFSLSKILKHEI